MENRKQKKLAPSSQKSFKTCMKYLDIILMFLFAIISICWAKDTLPQSFGICLMIAAYFIGNAIKHTIQKK